MRIWNLGVIFSIFLFFGCDRVVADYNNTYINSKSVKNIDDLDDLVDSIKTCDGVLGVIDCLENTNSESCGEQLLFGDTYRTPQTIPLLEFSLLKYCLGAENTKRENVGNFHVAILEKGAYLLASQIVDRVYFLLGGYDHFDINRVRSFEHYSDHQSFLYSIKMEFLLGHIYNGKIPARSFEYGYYYEVEDLINIAQVALERLYLSKSDNSEFFNFLNDANWRVKESYRNDIVAALQYYCVGNNCNTHQLNNTPNDLLSILEELDPTLLPEYRLWASEAYSRLAEHKLKQLRDGAFSYPNTLGHIELLRDHIQSGNLTLSDICTSEKELEKLTRRKPSCD